MEKLLFRRVELWVVILILILGLFGTIAFGWLALRYGREPHPEGRLAEATLAVAGFPDTVREVIRRPDPRATRRGARLGPGSGWVSVPGAPAPAADGYILVSRFSKEDEHAIVEMYELGTFNLLYRWVPDVAALLDGVPRVSPITKFERWTPRMINFVHPFLMANGDLIVKDHQSPLARVDQCGRIVWRYADDLAHHSTNIDAEGNLWVPTLIDPGNPDYSKHLFQDGITSFSPETGKVLFNRSLPDLMVKEGYEALLFGSGAYRDDPLHLNDIEPALRDSPYWKKGDLFLSMRHTSMIALYRPSTDRIIWAKQGPWLAQHDVDILDDHRIAVFNNNVLDRGKGWQVKGHSTITVYDFATGAVTEPYNDTFAKIGFAALTEGLFDITASGDVIAEETEAGHIIILGPDGQLLAEFINRAPDGRVYDVSWSRYIPRAEGDAALAALKSRPACGAE